MSGDLPAPPRRVATAMLLAIRIVRVLLVVASVVLIFAATSLVLRGLPLPSWMKVSGPLTDGMMLTFASLGLLEVVALYCLLGLLGEVIATVRAGDPFQSRNADRVQAIGWWMVVIQGVDMAKTILALSGVSHEDMTSDKTISVTGLGAIVVVFILAWVFRIGARMREELDQVV
ncbi:DUF2975 domain-containing protein [Brytella acorum]|uniref:DUF2975 domain-containing protein n=1 Tax=Brytella acorum TaxID=2959299 RepID=A0AA35V2G8_9PROT|nr:DUF2975 domain-containing protein [Brytella acorum]MDF3623468.1 DUF2975 domain-containing protein [Brytella acorum]CAI9121400.1 DUF2975 domain-containing protein [Brytella acorum]